MCLPASTPQSQQAQRRRHPRRRQWNGPQSTTQNCSICTHKDKIMITVRCMRPRLLGLLYMQSATAYSWRPLHHSTRPTNQPRYRTALAPDVTRGLVTYLCTSIVTPNSPCIAKNNEKSKADSNSGLPENFLNQHKLVKLRMFRRLKFATF